MAEILYTGQVTIDQLEQLIASCHFLEDTDTWVLAEQLPTHVIAHKQRQDMLLFSYFKQDIPFASYTSGRIFQEDSELRWEKQANMMHIVYLGSDKYISALRDYKLDESKSQTLSDLTAQAEPKYYYLFGERLQDEDLAKMGGIAQPGDFAQVRIPRLLHYPTQPTNAPYVCLQVREYIDPTSGAVALFRFQKLEPWR